MATSKPFLPPRWFIRVAWAVHRAIYRISGGRRGLRPPSKTYGTLRIHTIGRRTGEKRMAILGYFEDGPNLDGYAARRSRETAVVVFEPRSLG